MKSVFTDLKFRGKSLRCGERTLIMGILNVTPDSFSDGGLHDSAEKATAHALRMMDDGADIIDIGGESTKPGSPDLESDIEKARIVPVVQALKKIKPDSVISIDTRKNDVAEAALAAGADIINDVSGLQYSPELAATVAKYHAALVIMHMRGSPADMQSPENLTYGNLTGEITVFLEEAAKKAIAAGVSKNSIILDPGIGFSKNTEQNLEIMAGVARIKKLGYPILYGPSRKTFIGKILNQDDARKRIFGTAGAAAFLAMQKTDMIRVHDVKEIRDSLLVFEKCMEYSER